MKTKIFSSLILTALFFLASPTKIFADCQIADWNPGSRSLRACVGGFSSVSQLRSSSVKFNCLGNSNTGLPPCLAATAADFSLSTIPNDQIAQSSDGSYYTCVTGGGLSRAIAKMEVVVSGGQNCKTPSLDTKPSDWNALTEGTVITNLVSGEPGRTGGPDTSPFGCIANGSKGINTALGCISFDAENGGFVRSLLGIIIGLGGGIALLLILYGVFVVTTSAGIPDKLNEGKEIISSAVAGLVFIILAIFLMNLIGVKILALPGL